MQFIIKCSFKIEEIHQILNLIYENQGIKADELGQ